MKSNPKIFRRLALLVLPLASTLAGCTRDHKFQPVDMWNDTRLKPYEGINIPGGTNALPIPSGSIARGQLRADDALYRGQSGGKLATAFPFEITPAVLKRGQERYTVFCAPCHGGVGDGNGIIVQRGFAKPPDYAERRLVDAPVGHYYDVITNGYGAMYSYAARVPVNDRWAITAYIRVLQQARRNGKGNAGTIPGGGVYTPSLKSSKAAGHGTGAHGGTPGAGVHGAGDGHETAPGVAPGSVAIEDTAKSGGAAEGATHEKAADSENPRQSPDHSEAKSGPGGQTQLP